MIAADTSVVVAALASWHEGHEQASAAVGKGVRLPAHCLMESYSVLTRLPPPHRMEPGMAQALLRARFPEAPLALEDDSHTVLERLVGAGVSGGGVYDGLIGIIAADHHAVLLSRDRRAARVYAALGVRYELVGVAGG